MSVNSLSSFLRPGAAKLSGGARSASADAVSAISSKVAAALGSDYTAQLKAAAASDAESGAYGTGFRAVRSAQMQKTVSPDRAKAISQLAGALSGSGSAWKAGENVFDLAGLPYTAKVNKGEDKTTAEILDEGGEVIAQYDSEKGGWTSVATKAEDQFQTASEKVYRSAYQQVRAGILASKQSEARAGFDVKG